MFAQFASHPSFITRMEASTKGREKMLDGGYIYEFQKDLADNVKSFECEHRLRGQCKAKIKVDILGDIIGRLNEHTHPLSATMVRYQHTTRKKIWQR